jgi:hypothetical protein
VLALVVVLLDEPLVFSFERGEAGLECVALVRCQFPPDAVGLVVMREEVLTAVAFDVASLDLHARAV